MRKTRLFVLLFASALPLAMTAQVSAPSTQEPETVQHETYSPRLLVPGDVKVLSQDSIRETLDSSREAVNPLILPAGTIPTCTIENQVIVGACPQTGVTTDIPTIVVPVVFNLNNGALIFNPLATDPGCLGAGNTAISLAENSPIFSAGHDFVINGVNEGSVQALDAFARAEFQAIRGAGYNVVLSPVSLGPTLTISVTGAPNANGDAFNFSGLCGTNAPPTNPAGDLGTVNINFLQPLLQNYITAHAIPGTTFVIFKLYNVAITNGDATNLNNCCILGFHTSFGSGPNTYAIAEFEGRNQTLFTGVADVSVSKHEIGEWLDDPFGNNAVTPWGNIGQVSGCQGNLEVGDPLSGTLLPPITLNGFTYHLQELAFFSWFTHDSPSLGAGGLYSANGTFKGFAKPCPPGGTN